MIVDLVTTQNSNKFLYCVNNVLHQGPFLAWAIGTDCTFVMTASYTTLLRIELLVDLMK